MDEIFSAWDLDHNSSVTFDELKKVLSGTKQAAPAQAASKPKPKRDHTKSSVLGKDFDLDESPDALPISQQISNALRANAGRVLDFFRELDTSGDGGVSRAEFGSAMSKLGLEVAKSDLDALFASWDLDHDKIVTFDELKKVLSKRAS